MTVAQLTDCRRMKAPVDRRILRMLVILLRYFEATGAYAAPSVIKKRTGTKQRSANIASTAAACTVGGPLVDPGRAARRSGLVGEGKPLLEDLLCWSDLLVTAGPSSGAGRHSRAEGSRRSGAAALIREAATRRKACGDLLGAG
jgi:hypothetical protein